MSESDKCAWYVLIGEQKYGPYEYKEVIHMLQTNKLMDYNYVWAEHLQGWTPIHQLREFSAEKLQLLLQEKASYSTAFVARKNKRCTIQVPLMGHNGVRFFDGEIVSVSTEGGLCLLNSPLVQVGDQVKLHFKSVEESDLPFNTEADVIRKIHSTQRINSQSGLYYVVRFKNIQQIGLYQLKKWVGVA